MGKITGFLEIDRQDRKYAPAADRVRNYNEFVIPLGDEGTKKQAARCHFELGYEDFWAHGNKEQRPTAEEIWAGKCST